MGYIYVFEFPNGKRYVGATTTKPEHRWRNGKEYKGLVREAIDMFGWDSIKKYYWPVPNNQLDDVERAVIKWCDTQEPNGYNLESGGRKGCRLATSTRNKISNSLKGNKNNLGKKQSEETKKKRNESLRGRKRPPRSEEWCRKISEAKKGKKLPPRSEEYLRKQSESQKLAWAKKKGLA